MGRGIEMKKIEGIRIRNITFTRRRETLLKMARELAILCDAEVGVIILNNTGQISDFASTDMQQILARYKTVKEMKQGPAVEHKQEEPKLVDDLKEEISNLKAKQLRLLGKDLTGMSSQELSTLKQELNEEWPCIQNKKEQIMKQLEQTMLENEALRRQVDILRGLTPSKSYAGVTSEVPDLTLQLGLSSGINLNMEASDSEIQPAGLGGSFSYPPPNPPLN